MDVVDGANAIAAGAERARTKEEIDFMLDDLGVGTFDLWFFM